MTETHRDLLLEVGVEELPARFCSDALAQLKANAEQAFAAARLDFAVVEPFGTPRRLVLFVRELALMQRDVEVVAKGPSRKVAFDEQGRPTRAAEAFAKGQGVPVESLELRADEKGEYLYARRLEQGQSIGAVLPQLLADLLLSPNWPKSMRWADRSIRYARPIKWILALYGKSRVPFAVDGIPSGHTTRGHRTLGPEEPIAVTDPLDYFPKVNKAFVMVDHQIRKNLIRQQVEAEAKRLGCEVRIDEELLEEVNWLVEQPTAFAGSFAPHYLEVPSEVLVTTMKDNQRYFPVYEPGTGRLMPHFIGVRNGDNKGIDLVRAGNEKVIKARFADARFFFDEDRKQPLAGCLEKLKTVNFFEKLGTMAEKAERITALTGEVARRMGLPEDAVRRAQEAARLAKADLVTHMVYEFPELQGYMGKEYLLREGLDPRVAAAVYEHYLPRFAGDDLPASPEGIAAAIADKLDSLAGFFSVGQIPTGSQDPFALRRAAQGVTQTVVERAVDLDLRSLIDLALGGYSGGNGKAAGELMEFFRARLKVVLEGRGARYDVIDAVLAAGFSRMADAVRRAEVLNRALTEPEFAAVTGAFKRVSNLAAKAEGAAAVDPSLFAEEPERALWEAFRDLAGSMEAALAGADYESFYRQATRLKVPVDAFLDKVLVMAENPTVRRNRLALLAAVGGLLGRPADLGRLAG
jgi:glycyl-tRNA synthetase beta chain